MDIDPSVREITSSLARSHPMFPVSSNKISILNEPPEFYALLLDMIRRAEHRIFISSLYIGSARPELIDALRNALRQKTQLHLYLQLDLNRSTRPGPSSTAKILLPLLEAFPSRVHISLFRSPNLRGILAKLVPPRFNEGWGTWHAKIYGVDDEVMISGANLNQSYFTNRQDRYLHFSAQPVLAQYCFDFLRTISSFSYELLPSTSDLGHHSYHHEGYVLHWPDPATHPHHIHRKAELALSSFQASHRTAHELGNTAPLTPNSQSENVIVFPIIQAGLFNIREEENALSLLFRHLRPKPSSTATPTSLSHPLVDLTSGYFGLYQPYQEHILASDAETRIVVASPKANGFYGSKGMSGRIPEGYTLLEQRFVRAVQKAHRLWDPMASGARGRGVQLSEWEREGWTYHAKGIWVSPDASSPPVLTLFGSTNLNSRSARIDTELSFIMVVPSATPLADASGEPVKDVSSPSSSAMSIRLQLADEISRIRAFAIDWKGGKRKVRFWTKVIVRLVKGML
ncbi:CDP-diacylglycerol--glycerol-3-phosphate 3-phosphatidyltransferase [Hypsizygus marmoreus]|uniref:CDP-diacylglycerol--glycerol-3-phosphate 3-phosphatidyltransferase n=1 Tax=Hypsizygus marmoreus TaxID=39966 RepID=A0A369K9S2_HYPMA|nr:CDP-diacylglycerol--glycerol-3-phosphate 3-phosphatidyltransferase [Hypsizygus marmoreus]